MRRALRIIFGRAHIAHAVDDEIAFHLEMRMQRLIAAGLSPDDARREALRQFGDLEAVRRNCVTMDEERERAMTRWTVFGEVRQDVAYALRTLRRNAGFGAIVVLTLALGIGANTAMFTVIDAVLLRALDVRHPEQLVAVGDPTRVNSVSEGSARFDLLSAPLYRELRARNRVFSGLLATGRVDRIALRIDGRDPESARVRYVSGNYFSVLGVSAQLGRTFGEPEDGAVGASPAVVISHDYWQRRFGGDRAVVGRQIGVNGVPCTIVGVAQPGFAGEIVGTRYEAWFPLSMQPVLEPHRARWNDWDEAWLQLLGRLAPGKTLEQARAEATTILRQTVEDHVSDFHFEPPGRTIANARTGTIYVSSGAKGFSRVRDTFQAPLLILMAGVAVLLLIVCANVANLLLARAVARGREISVRLALGAGRVRLVRQLLTESLVLAIAGSAAGLLVAWWGSRLLVTLATDAVASTRLDLRLDLPVLAFALGVALLAVALFGLAPALRASRVDLATTMRAHARAVEGGGSMIGARGQRVPIGKVLITAQVALSLVLLVGAGLLVRSLRALEEEYPGLDRDHLLIVDVDIISGGLEGARRLNLVRDIESRLAQIPGVVASSYSENGIFSGTESETSVSVEGFNARSREDSIVRYDQAGPGYAHAIGARLLQGRDLTVQDDDRTPLVLLINETMARYYFPATSAIGQRVRLDSVSAEIVGVINDVKDHDLREAPVRRMYFPYLHPQGAPVAARFELRTAGDPSLVAPAARQAIKSVDATLTINDVSPLTRLMRQSVREERLLANLASGFGVGALLLAALGLYGVMTYAITRRTGELGLRVALGAQRGDLIGMVLGDALRLVAAGFAVGLPVALGAMQLLGSRLHGVGAADPLSISVALAVLAVSATLAVLVPAFRASRVAPIVALREE